VKFDPDRLYLLVISGEDPNMKLILLEITKQLTSMQNGDLLEMRRYFTELLYFDTWRLFNPRNQFCR